MLARHGTWLKVSWPCAALMVVESGIRASRLDHDKRNMSRLATGEAGVPVETNDAVAMGGAAKCRSTA